MKAIFHIKTIHQLDENLEPITTLRKVFLFTILIFTKQINTWNTK
ncbi:hypothetical protein [Empedobacter falsenii]